MGRGEGLEGEILRGEDRQVNSDHSSSASYVVGSGTTVLASPGSLTPATFKAHIEGGTHSRAPAKYCPDSKCPKLFPWGVSLNAP